MMLPSHTRVYIAVGFTDMRKSINGLSLLVADHFEMNVFSGHLFAFCNRRRDIVKILFWDKNGFCIWHKRLEKERFHWPQAEGDVLDIDSRQMMWLLAGLDINTAHKQLSFSEL